MHRGIDVGVLRAEDGTVPRGHERLAAGRMPDPVGDELLDPPALGCPGDGVVLPDRPRVGVPDPDPSANHSLLAVVGSNCMSPLDI